MGVFSPSYNYGLVCGVAAGAVLSLWMGSRDSIYERVRAQVGGGERKH